VLAYYKRLPLVVGEVEAPVLGDSAANRRAIDEMLPQMNLSAELTPAKTAFPGIDLRLIYDQYAEHGSPKKVGTTPA
jgi:hypothetical protein